MFLVIESQSFPCIGYVKKLSTFKHVKIEAYESFQKISFRNRYVISGANNAISLSIPIAGGREQKTLIKDVRIDNATDWQTRHWRTLLSAYNKAPFFDFYSLDVKNLIFSGESNLISLNSKMLGWICKTLGINVMLEFTDQYIAHYDGQTDCRNYFLPKSFQKDTTYLIPKYPQVFEDRLGFQPNLSIIDLIFCVGPNASDLLARA